MGDVKHEYVLPDGELLDSQFYQVTIEHELTDDPDADPWYTSYDVRNDTTEFLNADQAEVIAEYLAGVCEGPLAYSNTRFVGAVVRPWQRMTPEEEALYMMSVPLGIFGARSEALSTEAEMDRIVRIARRPTSGKRGRLDLRNSIAVGELSEVDHLVMAESGFITGDDLDQILVGLDGFGDAMDQVKLAMIGRVQTLPTVKQAAALGEKQVWTHTMSAPICRLVLEHNFAGLSKRQVHNS